MDTDTFWSVLDRQSGIKLEGLQTRTNPQRVAMRNHVEVRETTAMIAKMNSVLDLDVYLFCVSNDAVLVKQAKQLALSWFEESEGSSLILKQLQVETLGLKASTPMSRIELKVQSSLDGVGLTAAVATALANQDIPYNIVAAYHHDHVFVPTERDEEALSFLLTLTSQLKSSGATHTTCPRFANAQR